MNKTAEPTLKRNSILEERPEGCYYTGPLGPAVAAMYDEYGMENLTVVSVVNQKSSRVFIAEHRGAEIPPFDRSDLRQVEAAANQWGWGETEEEAWRYIIGSEYGPLDTTYEDEGYEHAQRAALGLDPLPHIIEATGRPVRIVVELREPWDAAPLDWPETVRAMFQVFQGTTVTLESVTEE